MLKPGLKSRRTMYQGLS